MKKKNKEDSHDIEKVETINDDLLQIFVKLYFEFVSYARNADYPSYILQLLKEQYEAAFAERQRLFETKAEFRLMDYYAERPDNLWLQIEKEMIMQNVLDPKTRKDVH